MSINKIGLFIISIGFFTTLCSPNNFRSTNIKGYTNNNLEVLDWGGNGTPIIFLTGLGNSAHVYEDFAPKFTDKHHVYGITRRGFGKSERTINGFSTDTLVLDILNVLDQLSLDKVILIGHSIAGDELSTMARKYPNRVFATIYLDAAYNHANLAVLGQSPQGPNPPDNIPLTIENVSNDQKKQDGFSFPPGEWKATNNIDSKGILSDDTTSFYSFSEILKAVKPISFKGIKCRSLAIYGKRETVTDRYKAYPLFDSTNKKIASDAIIRWNQYYQTELLNYRRDCQKCAVEEIIGGHHYVFLSHPTETKKLIKNFLKTL